MRTRPQSGRLGQVFAKWWRRIVVDECPDERRERIRRERIDRILLDIVALEALRKSNAAIAARPIPEV